MSLYQFRSSFSVKTIVELFKQYIKVEGKMKKPLLT